MDRDFNLVIDRHNTNSLKYDSALSHGKAADILPMWVADMDFQSPLAVSRRLEEISRFGIYGYSDNQDTYFDAVTNWYQSQFHWNAQADWIVRTPGIIFAIGAAIRALTLPGDAVMIQQPVYYPFSSIIKNNRRKKINSPLINNNGRYEMDFADIEAKIRAHHVKLFILCSPHNPVGRVWTKEELLTLGELCLKYGVTVISDEIHSDFVYPGHEHTVFASISEAFAEHSIICTSPSKTFNLAGLQVSNIFIKNEVLRKRVQAEVFATGYDELNIFALAACETAYREGAGWLSSLKSYLKENLDFLRSYIKEHLPLVRLVEPEGTYLVWLDFSALSISEQERITAIEETGKLWFDTGAMFGEEGVSFERINIACPRTTLIEALDRLHTAYEAMVSQR